MTKDGAKTSRRRDGLRSALLKLIIAGKLAGGQKLNELALSRQLKTSRTPLREALLHLEREGFVRSDLRRGFTVEALSSREVRETYPLIAELECFAVRESAGFLPLVFAHLRRINRQFARARDANAARALDTQWHQMLTSQSKNARLMHMLDGLRLAISRYECSYMSDAALVAISAKQHDEILGAFVKGDVAAGLALLQHNYRFGMQALLRQMGEE
jgi:DNA-binding GntR family transcriptional regulator